MPEPLECSASCVALAHSAVIPLHPVLSLGRLRLLNVSKKTNYPLALNITLHKIGKNLLVFFQIQFR